MEEEYRQPTWDELDELEEMLLDMVNDPEYRKEDWFMEGVEGLITEEILAKQAKCRLERKQMKVLLRSFQLHQKA